MSDLLKQVVEPHDDFIRHIPLSQGQLAIVDVSDYAWLNQWKWFALWDHHTKSFRAASKRGGPSRILMSRLITNASDNELVDHINRNTLDDRRINLRKCNKYQNSWNHKLPRNCRSGVSGVFWHKRDRVWYAYISVNNKRMHLGTFVDKQAAIDARNAAAIDFHGEFAVVYH